MRSGGEKGGGKKKGSRLPSTQLPRLGPACKPERALALAFVHGFNIPDITHNLRVNISNPVSHFVTLIIIEDDHPVGCLFSDDSTGVPSNPGPTQIQLPIVGDTAPTSAESQLEL
jgi:hypothetical protein